MINFGPRYSHNCYIKTEIVEDRFIPPPSFFSKISRDHSESSHPVLLFDGVIGINNSFIEPAEQGITLRNFMMDVL